MFTRPTASVPWLRFGGIVLLALFVLGGLTFLVLHRVEWLRWSNSFTEPFILPRGSVPMRISPETSFVTGPFKSDGRTLDFFAALENHYTPKNAPEENGFRDIVQLFGRALFDDISYDHWTELCRKLSLDPADPPRQTYLRLIDHLSMELVEIRGPGVTLNDAWDVYFSFGKPEVQKPEEMALLGSWLDRMAPALDAMEKALEKPVYFIPPCRTDGRSDLTIAFKAQRNLSDIFRYRIIYRRSIGDGIGAWRDALTMYRLARRHSRQPFFNAMDIAVAFDAAASAMAQSVLRSGLLEDEQLRQCLADLERLPEPGRYEDQIDTERIGLLQCMAELPEKGPAAFRIGLFDESTLPHVPQEVKDGIEVHNKTARQTNQVFRTLPFDWNIVAEIVNAGYDGLLGKETKNELFRNAPKLKARFESSDTPLKTYGELKRLDIGERSVELGKNFLDLYVPKKPLFDLVSARRDVAFELTRSMIALELYKKKHGAYPEHLAGLVEEKLLTRVPVDAYKQGEPLIYRREMPEKYILYSVGINGEDNDGKHAQRMPPDDPAWDDVAVEMP